MFLPKVALDPERVHAISYPSRIPRRRDLAARPTEGGEEDGQIPRPPLGFGRLALF